MGQAERQVTYLENHPGITICASRDRQDGGVVFIARAGRKTLARRADLGDLLDTLGAPAESGEGR